MLEMEASNEDLEVVKVDDDDKKQEQNYDKVREILQDNDIMLDSSRDSAKVSLIDNNRYRCCTLYSIDICPARISRLTQRETNHYTEQLVTDLFAQHQRFAVCFPYT